MVKDIATREQLAETGIPDHHPLYLIQKMPNLDERDKFKVPTIVESVKTYYEKLNPTNMQITNPWSWYNKNYKRIEALRKVLDRS